jgi:excisionase family DNA binding protein
MSVARTLLTPSEAAEVLRVTDYRIHHLARRGRIPGVVRIGRQVRFDAVELDEFIKGGGAGLKEVSRTTRARASD